MGCLISIPLLLLFIALFFGTALLRLVQTLLGRGPQSPFGSGTRTQTGRTTVTDDGETIYEPESGPSPHHRHSPRRRKIFGPDEGEYVDFEELPADGNQS